MNRKQHLTARLRDRIVSAIHIGQLHAGDRLPSIRQIAEETGADARAVAGAYRALEAEGLVEVRERSGVYAAAQTDVGGVLRGETARWAARVLVDGWKRAIPINGVPEFFRRCTSTREVRVAFVEASQDVLTAFTHDLREHLGLNAEAVPLESLSPARTRTRSAKSIPPALTAADLVLTTAFHAREVGPVAEALGKQMIAATVDPNMVAAVERQLRGGGLTVICADPRFGDRIRVQYQHLVTAENAIRVIQADDAPGLAALDRTEPVLLTRAARRRLGKIELPLVAPHSPTISSSSALEIAEFVIRFNLEAETQ